MIQGNVLRMKAEWLDDRKQQMQFDVYRLGMYPVLDANKCERCYRGYREKQLK